MKGDLKCPTALRTALLLIPLLVLLTPCSPGTPAPTPLDDDGRFVAATVALTCLGHRETAPRSLREETHAIYKRYGYDKPMDFLALTASFEKNTPIQERISKGIESCKRR